MTNGQRKLAAIVLCLLGILGTLKALEGQKTADTGVTAETAAVAGNGIENDDLARTEGELPETEKTNTDKGAEV